MSWTVVGKKNKKDETNDDSEQSEYKQDKQLTAEDLYKTSIIKSRTPISSLLINATIDETKHQEGVELINTLGAIAFYAVETMASTMEKLNAETKSIKDNQHAVLKLTNYTEYIKDICCRVTGATNRFEMQIDEMNLHKKQRMSNIKKFLENCGIEAVENTGETISPDIQTEHRKTYASAIGATTSDLIVDRPHVKLHTAKQELINVGITNISAIGVDTVKECAHFTINYIRSAKVFAMRAGSHIYTLGPGTFVNLKHAQERTKHAKRCRNPSPCSYRNCSYYHDPVLMATNYSTERNFALSYVMRLINSFKDDNDIIDFVKQQTDASRFETVRDLAQIGGMLIMRAVKIMALSSK